MHAVAPGGFEHPVRSTMIAGLDDKTVLIHFDPSSVRDLCCVGAVDPAASRFRLPDSMEWYCQWASEQVRSVFVLLPEYLKDRFGKVASRVGNLPPIWYADDGPLSLPQVHGLDEVEGRSNKRQVWVVNGEELPLVDWDEATLAAGRSSADVIVFGPPDWAVAAHYAESLQVDEGGEVTRFLRHYSDSPVFADAWRGPASLLVTSGEHASAAVTHILRFGWGLDSIGSLTRRFSVRWSVNGCVASRLALQRSEKADATCGALPDPSSSRNEIEVESGFTQKSAISILTVPDAAPNAKSCGEDSVDSQTAFTQVKAFRQPTDSTRHGQDSAVSLSEGKSENALAPGPFSTDLETGSSGADPTEHSGNGNNGNEQSPVEALDNPALYSIIKRAGDTLLAGVLLVVLAPVFVIVAILIKRNSAGPILFGHKRQGLNGREFRCWKFRTMIDGAESMQNELRLHNEVDGPQFKIARDPRLTRVGATLRRYNLDELPQLFNVLFGQMSFVGPRPSPDRENQLCPGWRRTRLSMRPGITGLWQVLRLRHESESDFQEWIYYDVEYARHRSFWLDLQIMLHTPLTMFSSKRLHRFAQALQRRGICVHSGRVN